MTHDKGFAYTKYTVFNFVKYQHHVLTVITRKGFICFSLLFRVVYVVKHVIHDKIASTRNMQCLNFLCVSTMH